MPRLMHRSIHIFILKSHIRHEPAATATAAALPSCHIPSATPASSASPPCTSAYHAVTAQPSKKQMNGDSRTAKGSADATACRIQPAVQKPKWQAEHAGRQKAGGSSRTSLRPHIAQGIRRRKAAYIIE